MNIVSSGNRYQVYGEDVRTYKELPAESYEVAFDKMTGFFLVKRPDLVANEEKIYGDHDRKANKVMNSFKLAERNFGIILSGQKGIGKSLLARVLAQRAIEEGMPVITVNFAIHGIADFLASIEQEVLIIFDEFDKVYARHDDEDPQVELLSLFDGMNNGKKLFCITCNDPNRLNEFLINRPGRFHYHFSISNPSDVEIREYLTDKLLPQYRDNIDKVVGFAETIHITYDYLRAVAFELNQGYSFEEILSDLNISRDSNVSFDIAIELSNGEIYFAYDKYIDLYSSKPIREEGIDSKYKYRIVFTICGTNIRAKDGKLIVDKNAIGWNYIYWSRYDDLSDEEEKALMEQDKQVTIKSIEIVKRENNFVKRYMV